MIAPKPGSWWPTIASGVLWGVVVGVLDTLGEPLEDLSAIDLTRFTMLVVAQWCVVGPVWAVSAQLAESRGHTLLGYLVALPVCCTIAVSTSLIVQEAVFRGAANGASWLFINARDTDVVAYLGWENAFYGGLYVLGYVATRRSVRLRQRLAEILRARGEADMILREARLRAYRGQLQPDMMVEALSSLRDLSRSDPPAADRMFERLVTFLRAAMPAVRTGRSTLADELTTLETYSAIRALIPDGGAQLTVECARPVADMPFPALILLPTLKSIAAKLPSQGRLTLRVTPGGAGAIMRLDATQPLALPVEVVNRLRAALRLVFGNDALVATGGYGRDLFEISLRRPVHHGAGQPGGDHVLC